jgi:hypothetical protein
LIAKRWIPEVNNAEIPYLSMLSIEEHDDLQRIIAHSSDEEEILPIPGFQEGRDESQSHNDDPGTEAVSKVDTPHGRSARLLYLGKQITQKGSIAPG